MGVVLRTVHRLLASEGMGSVTFGRVSRESGVSRTTLYRHWASPSELVSEAWSQVAPAKAAPHTGDLHDDLVALFRAVRDVVESATMRRSLPALLVAGQRDPVISDLHADFVRTRRQPIVERLRTAVNQGELAPDTDLELVVDLLSGPIFYRQLIRRQRTTDADIDAMVTTVLASVHPSP